MKKPTVSRFFTSETRRLLETALASPELTSERGRILRKFDRLTEAVTRRKTRDILGLIDDIRRAAHKKRRLAEQRGTMPPALHTMLAPVRAALQRWSPANVAAIVQRNPQAIWQFVAALQPVFSPRNRTDLVNWARQAGPAGQDVLFVFDAAQNAIGNARTVRDPRQALATVLNAVFDFYAALHRALNLPADPALDQWYQQAARAGLLGTEEA